MTYSPNNPNGQTTAANSSPLVLASDQTAIPVNNGFLNPTQAAFGALNDDLLPQTDVSAYKWVSLHVLGTFTATYTFQGTNEATPTNWVSIPALQRTTGQPAATVTGASANVIWDIPVTFRWIRVRVTAYTSGSGTANAYIAATDAPLMSTTGFVTQSGTWTFLHNATSNGTTGDVGAKTATFNGATQTLSNYKGGIITVLCGTVSGTTPTMSAQLQWSPDSGTTWLNLGSASGNVTATGNTISFMVYPTNFSTAGATPAALTLGATQNVQINSILPRTWRLVYTIGGTTPSFAITGVYTNYLV